MFAASWIIGWILLAGSGFCWSEVRRNLTAESGQTVTLPCRHPRNLTVTAVAWTRADLGDEYVLLYRDEQLDKSHQKASYWDRVDLQDRLMEEADVSLVLENARTSDTGTYQCRVLQGGPKVATGPICTIYLDVAPTPPLLGDKDGDVTDAENVEDDPEYGEFQLKLMKTERSLERVEEDGSDVLPVLSILLLSAGAFLILRARWFRPQIFRDMMVKRRAVL